MMFGEFRYGVLVTGTDRAEQILGLIPELCQVGTDGQSAGGHDEPPCDARGPLASGRGGSKTPAVSAVFDQVDSVLPADGRRPARRAENSGARTSCASRLSLPVLYWDGQRSQYTVHSFLSTGQTLEAKAEVGDKRLTWGFEHPQAGLTRCTMTLKKQ
jgi:hypothetical protein